jgi:hypothetical protein
MFICDFDLAIIILAILIIFFIPDKSKTNAPSPDPVFEPPTPEERAYKKACKQVSLIENSRPGMKWVKHKKFEAWGGSSTSFHPEYSGGLVEPLTQSAMTTNEGVINAWKSRLDTAKKHRDELEKAWVIPLQPKKLKTKLPKRRMNKHASNEIFNIGIQMTLHANVITWVVQSE